MWMKMIIQLVELSVRYSLAVYQVEFAWISVEISVYTIYGLKIGMKGNF